MPSKFVLRDLRRNSYYHVANWGGDGGLFRDNQDYKVFLFYLFIYTESEENIKNKYPDLPGRLQGKSLYGQVRVESYGLQFDHFHFILYQKDHDMVPNLMKRVINGYTAYYNYKYQHRGAVFTGRYKAVLLINQRIVSLLKRYIFNYSPRDWRSEDNAH